MNLKKISLCLIFSFGLFFHNQTLPMWQSLKSDAKKVWKSSKEIFTGTEADNYAKQVEKELPTREAAERIKQCVNDNMEPDPEDLFTVDQYPKIVEEYKEFIERAQETRREKNMNLIEETISTLREQNKFQCSSCWFFPD